MNGIYAAASGMIARSKSLAVIGNNVANINTSGYKSDEMLTSDFGNQVLNRADGDPMQAGINHGTRAGGNYTSHEQGGFEITNNAYDLAIAGDGLFTVTRPNGNQALTRSGHFTSDSNGYVVTATGDFLMGNNGRIRTENQDFIVNENGEVYSSGAYVDNLLIKNPANAGNLQKISDSLFTNTNNTVAFRGRVIQGAYETSNVELAEQMTKMISESRNFQACSQVIKQIDEITEKSVTEIGRL